MAKLTATGLRACAGLPARSWQRARLTPIGAALGFGTAFAIAFAAPALGQVQKIGDPPEAKDMRLVGSAIFRRVALISPPFITRVTAGSPISVIMAAPKPFRSRSIA